MGTQMSNIKSLFSDFTKKYNLSKTLRFELIPHFDTKKYLDQFIESDVNRDKDYKKLRQIIDEYHKYFIEKSLSFKNILKTEDLKKLDKLLFDLKSSQKKDKKFLEKQFKEQQKELRKQIVNQFVYSQTELKKKIVEKSEKEYKKKNPLFEKELITYLLPEWLDSLSYKAPAIKKQFNNDADFTQWKNNSLKTVKKFQNFTTYLTGFHENRKNMYSDKEQSTAIAYRIVHENLPKLLSNKSVYEKITKNFYDLQKQFEGLEANLKEEFDYFGIDKAKSLFEINIFNQCLTQTGIDNYNCIIGGKTLDNKQKIKGVNEIINLYRQNKLANKNLKISNQNLPFMQILHKQILSDRESHSFLPESFKDNKELCNAIQDFWKQISKLVDWSNAQQQMSLLRRLEKLFSGLSESQNELDKIYFNQNQLKGLSHTLFKPKQFNSISVSKAPVLDKTSDEIKTIKEEEGHNSWSVIDSALECYAENTYSKKERAQWLKKDFFHFQEIHSALVTYKKVLDTDSGIAKKITDKNLLLNHFQNINGLFKLNIQNKLTDNKIANKKTVSQEGSALLLSQIANEQSIPKITQILYNLVKEVLLHPPETDFTEQQIQLLKNFLDCLMDLLHLIKPLYLEKDRNKIVDLERDTAFYNTFEEIYEKLFPIIPLYNKCRNYIAKNKNHLEKIKINFEDSTLLDGWDVNKESDNLSVILRRKEDNRMVYYLGVLNVKNRKIFDYQLNFQDYNEKTFEKIKNKKDLLKKQILAKNNDYKYYEKMNYKLLPDPSKMLPKVFFSKKNHSIFHPSENIIKIKQKKTYAKNDGEQFSLKDCHNFINFYKESLKKHYDWKKFNFKFLKTDQYKDISEFYHEVSSQGYKLSFDKIRADYIEEKITAGELYLFKIHNKDFSKYSKGAPHLHTSYFKFLFDEKNLKDFVFKLNGKAEIFYRKASKKKQAIHSKNKPVKNKNPDNPKSTSIFNYDIIKDKRFTEDKFFFHVPITMNFKKAGMKSYQFNQEVLQFLKNNKNINIIGIDRGERHLAYWTVIDQNRNILEQGSFNKINNSYKNRNKNITVMTDYHRLLETKEKQRDKSRKSWTNIENIKDLKAGYLSHLVYQISKLMIEHNAMVVFEDLNLGFKRGRMKFEKQVYQKLEKTLIDKLNYLVFKNEEHKTPGGFLKAYQLTAPFESFKKIGKQTGFIFYTPAYYTSKVDPKTGFIDLIYPKYENIEKSRKFFEKFHQIYFDEKNNYFVFEYKDSDVNPKRKTESIASWAVCTHDSERYKYNRYKRRHIKVNVTEELKKLLDRYSIQYKNKQSFKKEICNQNKKDFFIHLVNLLKLIFQLRHINPSAKNENEKDFILSSVADETGRFFDSRTAKSGEPQNADANGAYHIGLKGLMILHKINKWDGSEKLNLAIKNKEWFDFIRNKKRY